MPERPTMETKDASYLASAEINRDNESEFLSAFFELGNLYQTLKGWSSQTLSDLKGDVKRDWQERGIEPSKVEKKRLAQIKTRYDKTLKELEELLSRLFDSPYTQDIFKRHLGQEIHSLDESNQYRQKLLGPFFNRFQEQQAKAKEEEEEIPEEQIFKQVSREEPEKWLSSLEKLRYLPGSHHQSLSLYLKFKKEQDLKAIFEYGRPAAKKEAGEYADVISKLEFIQKEEDFTRLEDQLRQSESLVKGIQSQWLPFLEKAEKFFPKETFTAIKAKREKKEKEKTGETGEALFREMREIFKEGFLGPEEVESAFTLQDGRKLIELTPEEQQEAFYLLEAKLIEPDIQEFLQKTPKQELAENWLLVLRLPKLQDNTPLTMKAMEEQLAPDMAVQNQGKLLYNVDWYPNESFYTTDSPNDMHWQFVTREVVSSTNGKNHSSQTEELKKAAKAVHLDPAKTRRRAPVETLFDSFVSLRAKGQRILETKYDWSDIGSADGDLVHVGHCGAGGAGVVGSGPEDSLGDLGASLSR